MCLTLAQIWRVSRKISQTCSSWNPKVSSSLNTCALLLARLAFLIVSSNRTVLPFIKFLQYTHVFLFYLHRDPMRYFFYNLFQKKMNKFEMQHTFFIDYNDNNRRKFHPIYPLYILPPFFHMYAKFY